MANLRSHKMYVYRKRISYNDRDRQTIFSHVYSVFERKGIEFGTQENITKGIISSYVYIVDIKV